MITNTVSLVERFKKYAAEVTLQFVPTVYVDASSSCNVLNFNLGQVLLGTPTTARSWNIKVSKKYNKSFLCYIF